MRFETTLSNKCHEKIGSKMLQDIEEPGALALLTRNMSEVVYMCTGPDDKSLRMLNNTLHSIAKLGMSEQTFVVADSLETCKQIPMHRCVWSSRVTVPRPGRSISLDKFWDWRFRFYYVKKRLLADLVRLDKAAIQTDTDTYWFRNPFPVLRKMNSSIVLQSDGPFANAGLMYARPGSPEALIMLDDVAWRIQLFQNRPSVVKRIVPFASEPYYANSDDQTILNDAMQSAVLGLKTFLGSTARFEAKNRYNNNRGPDWHDTAEYTRNARQLETMKERSKRDRIRFLGRMHSYVKYPVSMSDSIAIAPSHLFSHLVRDRSRVFVMHLAAVRGFAAKVEFLRKNDLWL